MQALDEVGVGLSEVAGEVGAGAAIPLADLKKRFSISLASKDSLIWCTYRKENTY